MIFRCGVLGILARPASNSVYALGPFLPPAPRCRLSLCGKENLKNNCTQQNRVISEIIQTNQRRVDIRVDMHSRPEKRKDLPHGAKTRYLVWGVFL